jgi:hypothetical protein
MDNACLHDGLRKHRVLILVPLVQKTGEKQPTHATTAEDATGYLSRHW